MATFWYPCTSYGQEWDLADVECAAGIVFGVHACGAEPLAETLAEGGAEDVLKTGRP